MFPPDRLSVPETIVPVGTGAQTRKRERGYTHTMLAVRRHPEDCSYLPLLGTAGGATWWQVSESKWACPRGTGLGFRRESRATAGPRDRRPAVSTMRARPHVRGAARSDVGRSAVCVPRRGEYTTRASARVCAGGIRKRELRSRSRLRVNSCLTRIRFPRETCPFRVRRTNLRRTF